MKNDRLEYDFSKDKAGMSPPAIVALTGVSILIVVALYFLFFARYDSSGIFLHVIAIFAFIFIVTYAVVLLVKMAKSQ